MPEQPPKTSKIRHFGVLRNKSSGTNISRNGDNAASSCFGMGHVFCLHHLGRWSTPAYPSTGVSAHLIYVLPVQSKRSKENI